MKIRRQLPVDLVPVDLLPLSWEWESQIPAKIPRWMYRKPQRPWAPLYFSIRLKIYFTTEYTQIENQDKYSKFAKSSFCSAATIYLATGRTDLNEILESDSYYLLSHYVFLHFEIWRNLKRVRGFCFCKNSKIKKNFVL